MNKDIYSIIPASPEIAQFVRGFMIANQAANVDIVSPAKPTGHSYLGWLVNGEAKIEYKDVVVNGGENSWHISGQILNNDITLTYGGAFKHILAEFTPLGFYQLFGIQGSAIVDQCISPPSQLSAEVDAFCAELVLASSGLADSDVESRLELYQVALQARIPLAIEVPDYLDQGIKILDANNGTIKIAEVAVSLNVTERQFSRKFTDLVGVPPKYYAQVLQMNKALFAMLEEDQGYLTEIAQAAGFFDQSHFIRVIQNFFACSPAEFLQSDEQMLFKFLGRSRTD